MTMREICCYLQQSYNPALFSMLTSKVKGSGAHTAALCCHAVPYEDHRQQKIGRFICLFGTIMMPV
jgi:hypothetical protein